MGEEKGYDTQQRSQARLEPGTLGFTWYALQPFGYQGTPIFSYFLNNIFQELPKLVLNCKDLRYIFVLFSLFMLAVEVLTALLAEIYIKIYSKCHNTFTCTTLYANDLSLVNSQIGLSLHLNAHIIHYYVVMGHYVYGETSVLKLIAWPKISNTYSVPEKTKGGPGRRAGNRGILSQQPNLIEKNKLIGRGVIRILR